MSERPRRIAFECPECGEEMEISARKAGEYVDCVECGAEVRVPRRSAGGGRRRGDDEGLSAQEFWSFAALFLLIPVANVFVSSVLYYVWKGEHPRKASQINVMGFVVFAVHLAIFVTVRLLLWDGGPP